jgi:hypothetical protein
MTSPPSLACGPAVTTVALVGAAFHRSHALQMPLPGHPAAWQILPADFVARLMTVDIALCDGPRRPARLSVVGRTPRSSRL